MNTHWVEENLFPVGESPGKKVAVVPIGNTL